MADGTATRSQSTFRLAYAVQIGIAAPPERVWALLTDADGFSRWNGAVTSLRGPIALGQKLELRVPVSSRTFSPKVTALEPSSRMVWSDGFAPMFRGVRTFSLDANGGGTTFSMEEVFSGLMLPMIRGSLPDFTEPFERFARDLKKAAEAA
jgi:hypothetical protein